MAVYKEGATGGWLAQEIEGASLFSSTLRQKPARPARDTIINNRTLRQRTKWVSETIRGVDVGRPLTVSKTAPGWNKKKKERYRNGEKEKKECKLDTKKTEKNDPTVFRKREGERG